MSDLTYTSYEGYGQRAKKNLWYSQAVRVGNIIECSGQGSCPPINGTNLQEFHPNKYPGGWDRETDKIAREINAQIEKAFENVEHTLKTAGAKGWQDVFFIRSYHVPMNDEAMEAMVRCLKQYAPDHQPAWTSIGVPRLAFDDMRVEIEVRAFVPPENKA
jgi:enamine deaminase RidA (YjgF/YER057c/UK114 family)